MNWTRRTTDYYAQDTKGNVWYFGEDSFDLEKHKYYAAGVGNVKTVMVEGGDEEYELVSVTR